MKIELDTHSRRFRWLVAGAIFAIVLVAGAAWLAAGSGPPVYTDAASGVAQPRQVAQGAPVRGKTVRVCNGTDTATGTATGDRLCYVDPETGGALPPGSPGQVLGVQSLTGTRTVVLTGTQTSVGTETYSYAQSVTGTGTGTITATGATGTYTYTATGTSTGMSTSGSLTLETGGTPRGVAVSGSLSNVVYVTDYGNNKLYSISVATPSSPSLTYTVTTCSNPRSVATQGSAILVACAGDNKLQMWDEGTGASAPTFKTEMSFTSAPFNVAACPGSSVAAVTFFNAGSVQWIHARRDTWELSVYGSVSTNPNPWGIAFGTNCGFAFVTTGGNAGDSSLQIVTGPTSPTVVKTVATGLSPRGVYVWGDYVAVSANGDDKLQIIDWSNWSTASVVGEVATDDAPVWLTGSGAYLYAVVNGNYVRAFDVSTPTSPQALGSAVSVGTTLYTMAPFGTYLGVAVGGEQKFKTVDVSRYLTPTGTQTQTRTVTATGTVTQTSSTTGTQTVATTGTFTSPGTGTWAGTGTAVEWTNKNDPMGTLFLVVNNNEGSYPSFVRWHSLDTYPGPFSGTPLAYSATCSTGNDALIATFERFLMTDAADNRTVFPGGQWLAKLRAKVNANGAAIRTEVYVTQGTGNVQWFNWTTDSFSNTSYATIQKSTWQEELVQAAGVKIDHINLYATCSASTTVTMELNDYDYSTRIETPDVQARVGIDDVWNLTVGINNLWSAIDGREPLLPTGQSGAVPVYTGSGTGAQTSKTTSVPALSVVPPIQMTKVQRTGTSTATATATTANPVTDRPTLTIAPAPVTFACAATNTALTFNGSLTLGVGSLVAAQVSNFTPRATTNYLRISYHITGTASAGATVTAMVDAVDSGAINAEWVDGSYLATTVPASGTGYLASQTIAWNANWTSLRNFRLRIGSTSDFVKPVSTQPGGGANIATACLYIEELTL